MVVELQARSATKSAAVQSSNACRKSKYAFRFTAGGQAKRCDGQRKDRWHGVLTDCAPTSEMLHVYSCLQDGWLLGWDTAICLLLQFENGRIRYGSAS